MTSHATHHLRFWLIAFAIFIALLWLLSPMLLPFVAALAIAYFLNPAVNLLGLWRLGRGLASGVILLSFILLVGGVSALLFPLVQAQLGELIDAIPGYAMKVQTSLQPLINNWLTHLSPEDVGKLREAASQYAGDAVSWVATVLQKLAAGSMAIFDILMLLVVTPVVAFYIMRDWPALTGAIDEVLPRHLRPTILVELRNIDRTLAGFVRGQALVCLFLGSFYAIGLSIIGLNYGMVVGLTAGLLSFVPYVGTLFGLITSLIIAALQIGTPAALLMVAAVFVLGQLIDANFVTPKLVGDSVGLHPVWIMFALFAGASLLGFLGILIAVPVAAIIGVVLRFSVRQYKASNYYQNPQAALPPPTEG